MTTPAASSSGSPSDPPQPPSSERPKKRGFETASDMVRSLLVVLVLVGIVFFLAQPPDSDKAEIRVIDPTSDIRAFAGVVPGASVPGQLPEGFRPTVAVYQSSPDRLRVGWNTPLQTYAEYQATTDDRDAFLVEATGQGEQAEPVLVEGAVWEQYVDDDGSISLVRSLGPVLVVVGGVRANASLDDLRLIAGSLVTTP